jgi:putative addiction module component (TIGR02574 family)
MRANLIESAKTLPLAERVELFDALWETLRQDGYEPALTPAQAAELDCRLAAYHGSPGDVVPWDQVKSEAEAKFGRHS